VASITGRTMLPDPSWTHRRECHGYAATGVVGALPQVPLEAAPPLRSAICAAVGGPNPEGPAAAGGLCCIERKAAPQLGADVCVAQMAPVGRRLRSHRCLGRSFARAGAPCRPALEASPPPLEEGRYREGEGERKCVNEGDEGSCLSDGEGEDGSPLSDFDH
jgi:hypothetical protein